MTEKVFCVIVQRKLHKELWRGWAITPEHAWRAMEYRQELNENPLWAREACEMTIADKDPAHVG